MKRNSKKIAIVIVTYNAQEYLPELFESLEKQNYPKKLVEVIVIDNWSADDTREFIKSEIRNPKSEIPAFAEAKLRLRAGRRNKFQIQNSKQLKIRLIENRENLGFAKGNNVGIKEALKSKPDYIVLLNQDMVVEPDWLNELTRQCHPEESGPEVKTTRDSVVNLSANNSAMNVGAVQPMIMLWDKNSIINYRIQTSGNKIHFLGFGYSGDCKSQILDVRCQISDVAYASGAAMLIKTEVLKKIGFFDEDFWAYHEDLDLGWRMRLAGYEIKRVSKSIVYHKYSFTKTKEKYYLMERNRLIVLLKYYKFLTLVLILPAFIFMEFGLWFFALKSGWGREKFRSYWDFLKILPQTLSKRKQVQKLRKIKDKDIIKYFTGKVEFEDLKHPLLRYIANPIFGLYWWIIRCLIFW